MQVRLSVYRPTIRWQYLYGVGIDYIRYRHNDDVSLTVRIWHGLADARAEVCHVFPMSGGQYGRRSQGNADSRLGMFVAYSSR